MPKTNLSWSNKNPIIFSYTVPLEDHQIDINMIQTPCFDNGSCFQHVTCDLTTSHCQTTAIQGFSLVTQPQLLTKALPFTKACTFRFPVLHLLGEKETFSKSKVRKQQKLENYHGVHLKAHLISSIFMMGPPSWM